MYFVPTRTLRFIFIWVTAAQERKDHSNSPDALVCMQPFHVACQETLPVSSANQPVSPYFGRSLGLHEHLKALSFATTCRSGAGRINARMLIMHHYDATITNLDQNMATVVSHMFWFVRLFFWLKIDDDWLKKTSDSIRKK